MDLGIIITIVCAGVAMFAATFGSACFAFGLKYGEHYSERKRKKKNRYNRGLDYFMSVLRNDVIVIYRGHIENINTIDKLKEDKKHIILYMSRILKVKQELEKEYLEAKCYIKDKKTKKYIEQLIKRVDLIHNNYKNIGSDNSFPKFFDELYRLSDEYMEQHKEFIEDMFYKINKRIVEKIK